MGPHLTSPAGRTLDLGGMGMDDMFQHRVFMAQAGVGCGLWQWELQTHRH